MSIVLSNPTGKKILGISEYIYNGVRFCYRGGYLKAFCFFSSFSKPNQSQKYNYIKLSTQNKSSTLIYFLDSDSPSEDPRGTYYFGSANNNYIDSVFDIINDLVRIGDELTYVGSSKGAAGALLAAARLGRGDLLINAPQIRIADYLLKYGPEIRKYLDTEFGIDFVNRYIERLAEQGAFKNIGGLITIGVLDRLHLEEHIRHFSNKIIGKSSVKLVPIPGAHDDVVLEHFQSIVSSSVDDSIGFPDYFPSYFSALLYFKTKILDRARVGLENMQPSNFDLPDDLPALISHLSNVYIVEGSISINVPVFSYYKSCVYLYENGRCVYKHDGYTIEGFYNTEVIFNRSSYYTVKVFYYDGKRKNIYTIPIDFRKLIVVG